MVSPIQRANDAAAQFMSDPNAAAYGMEGAVRDELSKLRGPGQRDRREAENVLAEARRMITCMPAPPRSLTAAVADLEAMLAAIPRDAIEASPSRPGLLGLAAPRAALPNALAAEPRRPAPASPGAHAIQRAVATVMSARATTGLDVASCAAAASTQMSRAQLPSLAHLTLTDATRIARAAGAGDGARTIVDAVAQGAGIAFWGAVRDDVTTSLTRTAANLRDLQRPEPLQQLCRSIADGDPTAIAFARTTGADYDRLLSCALERDIAGLADVVGAGLRAAGVEVERTRDGLLSQRPHPVDLLQGFPFAVERVASRVGLQMATLDFERPPTFVLEQGARAELDAARFQGHVASASMLVTSLAVGLAGGAWAAIPLALGTGAMRSGAAWEAVDDARAAVVAGDTDAGAVDRSRDAAVETTVSSIAEVGIAAVGGIHEVGAARAVSTAEAGLERAEVKSAETVLEAGTRSGSAASRRAAEEALDGEVSAARNLANAERAETRSQLVHSVLDAARDIEPHRELSGRR